MSATQQKLHIAGEKGNRGQPLIPSGRSINFLESKIDMIIQNRHHFSAMIQQNAEPIYCPPLLSSPYCQSQGYKYVMQLIHVQ